MTLMRPPLIVNMTLKKKSLQLDFAVSVDLVLLTLGQEELQLLTIRRRQAPHRGKTALPGAFVQPRESLEAAVARTLQDEGGLSPNELHFEQLSSFGSPSRDPRGRVLSVAYLAIAASPPPSSECPARESARWTQISALGKSWAFDHETILQAGLERARAKLEYTNLATSFCPPEFSLSQLRQVYEKVWGCELDPANFRRKVLSCPGFVVPTRKSQQFASGRPAKLFRAGPASLLHPAIHRP